MVRTTGWCQPRSHLVFTMLSPLSNLLMTSNFTSSVTTFCFFAALSSLLTNSLFWWSIFVKCRRRYHWKQVSNTTTCFTLWTTGSVINHQQTFERSDISCYWPSFICIIICEIKSYHQSLCNNLVSRGNWNFNHVVGESMLFN